MMIKAVCTKHPDAVVYLLQGTTKFWFDNKTSQELTPIEEWSERSSYVELDEANLYCTADDPYNHDVHFKVI